MQIQFTGERTPSISAETPRRLQSTPEDLRPKISYRAFPPVTQCVRVNGLSYYQFLRVCPLLLLAKMRKTHLIRRIKMTCFCYLESKPIWFADIVKVHALMNVIKKALLRIILNARKYITLKNHNASMTWLFITSGNWLFMLSCQRLFLLVWILSLILVAHKGAGGLPAGRRCAFARRGVGGESIVNPIGLD